MSPELIGIISVGGAVLSVGAAVLSIGWRAYSQLDNRLRSVELDVAGLKSDMATVKDILLRAYGNPPALRAHESRSAAQNL